MKKLFIIMILLCSAIGSFSQTYVWPETNIQYTLGAGLTVTVSNGAEVQTCCPNNTCTFRIFIWNDPDFRDCAEVAKKIFEATPGDGHEITATGYNYGVQQSGLENQKIAGTVNYNGGVVKCIVYAYKNPDLDKIIVGQYIYTMGVGNDADFDNHAESLFNAFRKVGE